MIAPDKGKRPINTRKRPFGKSQRIRLHARNAEPDLRSGRYYQLRLEVSRPSFMTGEVGWSEMAQWSEGVTGPSGNESFPVSCDSRGMRVVQLPVRLSGRNGLPVVWQKLSNAVNRIGGNARKHVFEPGERLHTHPLTGCREASQDGCSLATPVTAEEDPVVASDRHPTDIAFGGIVIDAQVPVF